MSGLILWEAAYVLQDTQFYRQIYHAASHLMTLHSCRIRQASWVQQCILLWTLRVNAPWIELVSLNNDGWSQFAMGFHLWYQFQKQKVCQRDGRTILCNSRNVDDPQLLNNTVRFFRIVLDSIGSEVELKPLHIFTPFVSGGVEGGYSPDNSRHSRCQRRYLRPRYGMWSLTWIIRLSQSLNMHAYRTYLQLVLLQHTITSYELYITTMSNDDVEVFIW